MTRTGKRLRVSDRVRIEDEIARAQRTFEHLHREVARLDELRHRARTEQQVRDLTERKREAEAARDQAAQTWRYLTTLLQENTSGRAGTE